MKEGYTKSMGTLVKPYDRSLLDLLILQITTCNRARDPNEISANYGGYPWPGFLVFLCTQMARV